MKLQVEVTQNTLQIEKEVFDLNVYPFDVGVGAIQESLGVNKGDVAVFNGTDWIRLGVGDDGQALVADSGEEGGLGWGAAGAYSTLTNKDTVEMNANDVVIHDFDNDEAFEGTTTEGHASVAGVLGEVISVSQEGAVYTYAGTVVTVNCDTGAVAKGEFLITSTTKGRAKAGTGAGIFAVALTAKASGAVGTVKAKIIDRPTTVIDNVKGRLTLTSGTPVTTADVTAATTLYFALMDGNTISLYDGTSWEDYEFTELSKSLAGLTADTNYDVFIELVTGAPAIATLVAWTNATTRATALAYQDGRLVLSGSSTKRYVGTIRTTGTIGQAEDSKTKRFVWNYYNRVERRLRINATSSWTYASATWRTMKNETTNLARFVIGVSDRLIKASQIMLLRGVLAGECSIAIALDSITVVSGDSAIGQHRENDNQHSYQTTQALYSAYPAIGFHYFACMEKAISTGTNYFIADSYQQFEAVIYG